MIRALQPIVKDVFGGAHLMKIAEQGLGVAARREILEGRDYRVALQERLNRLVSRPEISQHLSKEEIATLSDLPSSEDSLYGYPIVGVATAKTLFRLLLVKDHELSALTGTAEQEEAHFVELTDAEAPYFALLKSLEDHEVVKGIYENNGLEDGVGFTWQEPSREFEVNESRIAIFAANEPHFFRQATRIIKAGQRVDQDAETLLRYFQSDDPEQGPKTVKL